MGLVERVFRRWDAGGGGEEEEAGVGVGEGGGGELGEM